MPYGTDQWWWESDKDDAHQRVFEYVSEVERTQHTIYNRFLKLAYLYDPNDWTSYQRGFWSSSGGVFSLFGPDANISENVIASNVDTVTAIIAASEPRPRFMTDDGDWSTQRRARHLEWYADGLVKRYDVYDKVQQAFKDAAIKGTGVLKVYADGLTGEICVDRVLVDDVIVDEGEARAGDPRQMHERRFVDRDVLKSEFPEHEDAIERAQRESSMASITAGRYWADYRPIEKHEVVVIESYRLPIGKPEKKGYVKGRHTICIDGATLVDEDWEKPFYPYAVFRWSKRSLGWYGIGLAERIAGHQRALNKLNWQIDRQLDQLAVPTTYVRMADANLAVKATNRAGAIVPFKSDIPQTVIPKAVSPETYQQRQYLKDSAYDESGVSRMSATGKSPLGKEASGAAFREYRDITTQRFASQEKGIERCFLDVVWLMIDACKDLGKDAPEILRKSKFGQKRIRWRDVDMGEVKLQLQAASNISRTPAGRIQLAMEMTQNGIITTDEFRRLLRHPDFDRAMSLHVAALEDIERCIEEVLDGNFLVPEPYQNLKLGTWRFQMAYLKARDDGAPEEILEGLRTWIVQAAHVLSLAEADQAALAAPPPGQGAVPPLPPEALPPGALPPGPGGVPPLPPEAMGVPPM